jgi:hypothetical protein
LTEVKKIISHEFKEVIPERIRETVKKPLKNHLSQIFAVPTDLDSINSERKLKRVMKRWKKSIDYYYSHLEKFEFGFKDLK